MLQQYPKTMNRSQTESKLKAFLAHLKRIKKEEIAQEAYTSMLSIEEVDVNAAFSSVQRKIKSGKRKVILFQLQRMAAILFIPLAIATVLLVSRNSGVGLEYAQETISNPTGIRSQVELPDGSTVWLNSGSTISYSNPFSRGGRMIELSGEAYFEVASDPKNPFTVDAGPLAIEVLGTRFNVKRYPEDAQIEVSLEEGKIDLISGKGSSERIHMNPGMRAEYQVSSEKLTVGHVESIEKFSAWQKGMIVFDDTPFPQVVKTLERWYSVDIDIESDEIRRYKLTTTFKDQTIDQVIELLELSSPITIELSPLELHDSGHIKTTPRLVIKNR